MKSGELTTDLTQHLTNRIKLILLQHQISKTIDRVEYAYWPLFFEDGGDYQYTEIDTCATSLGILALSMIEGIEPQLLRNPVKTLLRMRNADGSWPSTFQVVGKRFDELEGVINDTVYAISALLEVGLLDLNSILGIEIDPITQEDLKDVNQRFGLIKRGVDWIIENRVVGGWDYKGTKYFNSPQGISAAVLPTTRIVVLLAKLALRLEQLIKDQKQNVEPYENYLKHLKEITNETLDYLVSVQNEDYGFGKKKGDSSKLVHTALAIQALRVSVNPTHEKCMLNALRFILHNSYILKIQSILTEEFFDEYDQIIISQQQVYKRMIKHENYAESILLQVLLPFMSEPALFTKLSYLDKRKLFRVSKYLFARLLSMQTKEGDFQGSFVSRRGTLKEKYPIYTHTETLQAMIELTKNLEAFKTGTSKIDKSQIRNLLVIFFLLQVAIGLVYIGEPNNLVLLLALTLGNILINLIAGLILFWWIGGSHG